MPNETVLAIDDDKTIIAIVEKTLENHGYECICAANGEDGLNTLAENHETISAIILDIKMPNINGDEVLKKIKADPKTNAIPVIMLTGQNSLTELSQLLEIGANDYMTKPFDPDTLVTRIKIVLGSHNKK